MVHRAHPQVYASVSTIQVWQKSVVLLSFRIVLHHHYKGQFAFIRFNFVISGQKNKPIVLVSFLRDCDVILLD